MADKKYDSWDIQKIEDEIMKMRLKDLTMQRELCFMLSEKAKMKNDWYALAFSYTYLGDYYLSTRKNKNSILYLGRAKELSELHHFNDLLIHIYNFYGMFYNSIYDEVMALDYYLKALDIAEDRQEQVQMGRLYNNIATCFDIKHNYEEAIFYYKKGYHILEITNKSLAFPKGAMLANLCSCAYKLNQLSELEDYLNTFDVIIQNEKNEPLKFIHLYCSLLKWGLRKEDKAMFETMDQILTIQGNVQNRLLVYQVLTNICELLLDHHEQEYTKIILDLLSEINHKNDVKAKKELQKLIVRYCEEFGTEEKQLEAYREFYKILMTIEDMGFGIYSTGLSAKLELHETKAKQSDMEKLMNIDDLTGTLNRRCFNHDIISDELCQADSLGIVMLDIDYFKEFNDIYGHQMGDMALIEVGKTLNAITTATIQSYRYGGDEFSIIFKNEEECVIKETIQLINDNIQQKDIEHLGSKTSNKLTVCCGYAYTEEPEKDVVRLVGSADFNLYKYKKSR